jgi:rare lipoprotein A
LKTSLRKQSERFLALLSLFALLSVAGAPRKMAAQSVIGNAVYYNDRMNGRNVAQKGEKYDSNSLTAATHRTFPLGSTVRVTNLKNRKSVLVRVNDRMNPKSKSVIDLSKKAAETIGLIQAGRARVRVQTVSRPQRVSRSR